MRLREINRLLKRHLAAQKHIIIAITGGSCSGKTCLAKKIATKHKAVIISMDDYYKGGKDSQNFDIPSALDIDLLAKHLQILKQGRSVKKPLYDMKTHSRNGYTVVRPQRIIIYDGLFALHRKLRKHADIKIFIESPVKKRFRRRLKRDVKERGRVPENIKRRFYKDAEPAFRKYVLPTKKFADVVIKN